MMKANSSGRSLMEFCPQSVKRRGTKSKAREVSTGELIMKLKGDSRKAGELALKGE